jgi:hypothetical protein
MNLVSICTLLTLAAGPNPECGQFFKITVVDEATGRGVPLVELQTTNSVRYYTDSNGIAAFYEPGLMNGNVFFTVKSHGYEFAKDGFGIAGRALKVTPGGSAELKIKRINIAERLYRITGGGIYRDSVLTGTPVPTSQPVLNGKVFGQDSILEAVYRGKIYWFYGDTGWPEYPLGNFNMSGATLPLPAAGGLDPDRGVNLTYFVGDKGFARAMAPIPGEGPTWLGGPVVLKDGGRERMLAMYSKIKGASMETYERGMSEWDDATATFKKTAQWEVNGPITPNGHTLFFTTGGQEYVYYAGPFPLTRVPAKADLLKDLANYENYTCLKEGARLPDGELDRDSNGRLRYAWRHNTPLVGQKEQGELVKAGRMKPEEGLLQLCDIESGKPVLAHGGSVNWNDYRKRYVMVFVEFFGTSLLGEMWYAEADTPLGPWVYARKIVTHDKYTFYNPKQHPAFDRDGGRFIYFQGTYTNSFSGNPDQTPRYDYNQIMYKLDLADGRLILPSPVYQWEEAGAVKLATGSGTRGLLWDRLPAGQLDRQDAGSTPTSAPEGGRARAGASVAFFAPDRQAAGTVPVTWKRDHLSLRKAEDAAAGALFFALPADTKTPPKNVVPLYQYYRTEGGRKVYSYSTKDVLPDNRLTRTLPPICLVWTNPGPEPVSQ